MQGLVGILRLDLMQGLVGILRLDLMQGLVGILRLDLMQGLVLKSGEVFLVYTVFTSMVSFLTLYSIVSQVAA